MGLDHDVDLELDAEVTFEVRFLHDQYDVFVRQIDPPTVMSSLADRQVAPSPRRIAATVSAG
jgi:hypothetical protein